MWRRRWQRRLLGRARGRGLFLRFFSAPLLNHRKIAGPDLLEVRNRLQELLAVKDETFLALRARDFKLVVHENGVEGARLFADPAIHADRDVDVKNFGLLEGPALFVDVADDINAFRRAFFGANVEATQRMSSGVLS